MYNDKPDSGEVNKLFELIKKKPEISNRRIKFYVCPEELCYNILLVRYLGTGIQLIYPIIDKGLQIMSVQRI